MNIDKGFQFHAPSVFVPWAVADLELEKVFAGHATLQKITDDYYTVPAEPFPGLNCIVGFHLHEAGKLSRLEFFRNDYSDQKASFDDFQHHFEAVFGNPNFTTAGTEGFPIHAWNLPNVIISHYVFDRFGPEEHMEITKR